MAVALPLLFVVVLWWGGTGVLILLARAAERAERDILLPTATILALGAGAAAVGLREVTGTSGAYLGFTVGIVLWAWHELAFLSGAVTGPIRVSCPPHRTGWARFRHAVGTILHHELALAATLALLALVSVGAANAMAFLTFLVLWGMRLSAKLNLFAGVPNPNDHLFPPRLAHLASLVPPRRMSPLLPASLVLIAGISALLFHAAHGAAGADEAARAGFLLLGGLAILAGLEHLAMGIPLRLESLWRAWGWKPPEVPGES